MRPSYANVLTLALTCHLLCAWVRRYLLTFHLQLREIRRNLPTFLAEITQLLDTVPRQLVLILKTNDLLRGIEHVLGTQVQRRSYLTMSRYCLRAIGEHEERMSVSWVQWALCRTRTNLSILFVRLYETWLWWKAVLSL